MGFIEPTLPKVDLEEFLRMPLQERLRIMCLKWVDDGYGAPRMIHVLYIVKLVFFYALGGVVIATATSHLPAFWHVSNGGTSRSSTRRSSCGPSCWNSSDSPAPGGRWPARPSR